MPFSRLTEEQLETFREIGHVGMEHAGIALSQLTGDSIRLRVPRVTVSEIDTIPVLLGGIDGIVAGIILQVLGDARGSILLVFPRESAHRLLARLLGQAEKGLVINDLGASTLKEVGNILASAYLSALGDFLRLSLIPSVPLLAFDTAGAVLDYVRTHLSHGESSALLVETEFLGAESGTGTVHGHFFFLPEASSLRDFLSISGR
jgi:chemotaxis protein CheC